MFQALIDQAYDMIQRLYACAEKGRNEVPLAVAIRYSEFEAWETTASGIISTVFGPSSHEVARWRTLAERRAVLLAEGRRNDMKRGEFLGLIDYFNLAAGVLREYDAFYQHDKAAAQAAPGTPADNHTSAPANSTTNISPVQVQQPIQAPNSNSIAVEQNGEPPIARRASANQWDVVVSLNNELYTWLSDMAAAREPSGNGDGSSVARLVTTIIERVALQTQRGRARDDTR